MVVAVVMGVLLLHFWPQEATQAVDYTPTVFNSRFNFSQFWDGRAPTLEKQIEGPVQNKIETDSSCPEVIGKLKASPEYVQVFRQIYSGEIDSDHIEDSHR